MTERVLGSTGSPRRRWTMLVPLTLAIVVGLFYIAGAQAVHEAGAFELDALSANAVDDPAGSPDDWDNICADNPSTCTFKSGTTASTSSASSSSHENDGDLNATIFQGGGSKDEQPIANWLWKDGAGGLPDKDNLLHAYAARYTIPSNAGCVGDEGLTDGTDECTLIYFGSDRFANDGDATQAFWFLQNKVAADGPASKGGNQFTGSHRDGDVLVISEFSNGGTKSDIAVYKWVGDDATGGVEFVAGGDNKDCDVVPEADPFCGIVNKTATDEDPTFSPWEFLDKGGSTDFRQGELFEAGINLSDPSIALADECFSSFVAETRASTSLTATLKDFIVGQFEVCDAAMTTQASTNGTVTPGTAVTDTATITVTGAASPDDPTGTVTFFLCGPIATGDCGTSGGTNVGTGTLVGGTPDDGIATAQSPTVNDSSQTGARGTLAAGRYCFRATWPGDSNYTTPLNVTNDTTECFTVADTTTAATAQTWLPNDSATITSAGDSDLDGTVRFQLYSDGECGADGGTVLYQEDVDIPASTASPHTVNTTNGDGDPATGLAADLVFDVSDSTVNVSWRVVFTSDDTGVGGSTANCETSTGLIIDDDNEPTP